MDKHLIPMGARHHILIKKTSDLIVQKMHLRPFIWPLALLLLILLTGCDTGVRPLKIGSNQWPGYEPLYLARDLGLLRTDTVKLVELPSASDVMQYLKDGILDAGMLTLDETLTLLSGGVDVRVVLVMDISNGADAVLSQPSIQTLSDIRGKYVGVERSALGAVMLESLLGAAVLQKQDIHIVNLTVDRQEQAFMNDQVDVVITFEPTRSKLLMAGAKELFSSRQIPGRIIDVLVVRAEAIHEHAEQIHSLTQAYFEAVKYIANNRSDSMQRIAPRLGITPQQLETAYDGLLLPDMETNRSWLTRPGDRLTESARRLLTLMKHWQLLKGSPDVSQLPESRFLESP